MALYQDLQSMLKKGEGNVFGISPSSAKYVEKGEGNFIMILLSSGFE